RRQYHRLFLNANEKKDAARIMASVFRAPINSAAKTAPALLVPQQAQAQSHSDSDGSGDPSQPDSPRKLKLARKSFDSFDQTGTRSCKTTTTTTTFMKRIRLTIEPNTGQSLPLGHLESSLIE